MTVPGFTTLALTMALVSCSAPPVTVRTHAFEDSGPPDHKPESVDPRVTGPRSMHELRALASRIAKRNDLPFRGRVVVDASLAKGNPASIRTRGTDGVISVRPDAARRLSVNTWAFIFGHEFAHQALGPSDDPEAELNADLLGAQYAARAGFDPAAYMGWLINQDPHGDRTRQRVTAIGRALKVPAWKVDRWRR